MAERGRAVVSLPNSMLEDVNLMLPMKLDSKSYFMIEAMKLYINEKRRTNLTEKLKEGYKEMSRINLALAEMGLEQDNLELIIYEARLTGRGI